MIMELIRLLLIHVDMARLFGAMSSMGFAVPAESWVLLPAGSDYIVGCRSHDGDLQSHKRRAAESTSYRDSSRLAVIWSDFRRQAGYNRALTAPALFFDRRDRSRSFESVAAFVYTNPTFTALDQPITPPAHKVIPNFFYVVGVAAFRGRTFLPDEGTPAKDDVVLISYSLWRSVSAARIPQWVRQ